ncbi:hypothetical protein WMF37_21920 [Sorangium sp. So ce291]|uniref:hypothetical protein n=1 Tax=Sorangium sp. So ce291 TaxID=3133294 RepID=UPI003F6153CC
MAARRTRGSPPCPERNETSLDPSPRCFASPAVKAMHASVHASLWFNNTDHTGGSIWDSRHGQNYWQDVKAAG